MMKYLIPAITSIIVAIIGTWGTIHVAGQAATQALSDSKDAQEQIKKTKRLANTLLSGGTIDAAGQKEVSIGRSFSVSREGHKTRITYDQKFEHTPVVVVTPHRIVNEAAIPRIFSLDDRSIVIDTLGRSSPVEVDCKFSFIVLEGPE